MKIDEIRPLQKTELLILIETDKICKELGIKYYLIGGTLLGAVRHGGFIPWDVDIDIAMVREDYEKFRKYCIESNSDKFFYEDYTTEKHHSECHAILKLKGTEVKYSTRETDRYTVQHNGIYMDIFPLDYAPNEVKKQKRQQRKIKFISSLIQAKICRDYGAGKMKYLVKKILSIFLRPVSFSFLQKWVDGVMQKYNDGPREYLVSMASHYSYKKQFMSADIYGEPKKIIFEGLEFYAPAKTEDYLIQLFGDYMKLPPEDQRSTQHLIYVDFGEY